MRHITIREHGRLTTSAVEPSLDRAQIGESDFDWLLGVSSRMSKYGARLAEIEGRRTLSLDNYVGVLETPGRLLIEIVPKCASAGDDLGRLRSLLLRMVADSLDVQARTVSEANIQALKHPMSEWVAIQFLQRLDALIKRGLRFQYQRIEEECKYLRGQLDVGRQIRQPSHRAHLLHVRHDEFTPERPENRLLCLALRIVNSRVLAPETRRLSNALMGCLNELMPSTDVDADFTAWSDARLMSHYADVRPWCELIVRGYSPITQLGKWRGLSMLFPMELLFERYVAKCLRRVLSLDVAMTTQARAEYLCAHKGQSMFMLKPDIVLERNKQRTVLDTKWKVLDSLANRAGEKYGLSQGDFYQLFAYGHRYQAASGEMMLIYPTSESFFEPLDPFHYSSSLRLWVVPFDLENGRLVDGAWRESMNWLAMDELSRTAA